MAIDVEWLYRQHLTEADRRLLTRATGKPRPLMPSLADPAVEAAVFRGGDVDPTPWAMASPFLAFAVAVHRTSAHLALVSFVREWAGLRQRVPVFDVGRLRDLLADPLRRFFLVELLASYTHVSSGVSWERTARGWRRRRFSELDPLRLAGLLDSVGEAERPGIYRRLGDLALFLTGVFPDHTAVDTLGAVDAARLLRLSGAGGGGREELGGVALLEHLGSRWYRLSSASLAGVVPTGSAAVVGAMGERFVDARRVLNVVTDLHLFPLRERWFG